MNALQFVGAGIRHDDAGWRMPANTAKVDRTTRWGNHPAARAVVTGAEAVRLFARWVENEAPEEWKYNAHSVNVVWDTGLPRLAMQARFCDTTAFGGQATAGRESRRKMQ
jgi:hypothetical protein